MSLAHMHSFQTHFGSVFKYFVQIWVYLFFFFLLLIAYLLFFATTFSFIAIYSHFPALRCYFCQLVHLWWQYGFNWLRSVIGRALVSSNFLSLSLKSTHKPRLLQSYLTTTRYYVLPFRLLLGRLLIWCWMYNITCAHVDKCKFSYLQ